MTTPLRQALGHVALLLAMVSPLLLAAADPEQGATVGRTHVAWVDEARRDWTDATQPRPLAATIWYPTAADAALRPWQHGAFAFGHDALEAPLPSSSGRRPLVLVSHGTGGSAAQLAWLAQALASRGFIVAGVNHHGNTAAEPDTLIAGFVLWWERARDLSVLLDRLLADPHFAGQVDPQRIGVAGFSLGGYTAMLSVGARVDRGGLRRHCRSNPDDGICRPSPESRYSSRDFRRFFAKDPIARASAKYAEDDHRDPRIRAAFVIAPALAPALDGDSLATIQVPVRGVTGDADDIVSPATVHALFDPLPRGTLAILPGVGHYTFLAPCTDEGRSNLPQLCNDNDGIDRRTVHAQVADDAIEFFTAHLCAVAADAADGSSQSHDAEIDPCSIP